MPLRVVSADWVSPVSATALVIAEREVPSTARLEVSAEGAIIAYCGTPDIGNGSDTALAQIAAEAAGVSIGRIQVVSGDFYNDR